MWFGDGAAMTAVRERLRASSAWPECAALRAQAAAGCRAAAPAVTEKTFTRHSPSQDPHDYVSIATYYWPNPEGPDGLPYVSRDGLVSPDMALYDRPRWERAAGGMVTALRAAWFFREPRYAADAARRLRVWFLDDATRMNPHLTYAQMVPGEVTGRPYGIIDFGLYLPGLFDLLGLVAPENGVAWTAADQAGLEAWAASFLIWLESHPLGREEDGQQNNHGTFFDRLVVALALFTGQREKAAARLMALPARVADQVESDGSQPRELARTCSFGYSLINARALVELAWAASRLDLDLWSWSSPAGASIPRAVEFLYRHACRTEDWPWEQIEPIDWRMIVPVLELANALSCGAYPLEGLAHRLPVGFSAERFRLVEPLHPFGENRTSGATV